MHFENKLELGIGIYTSPDIARILQIPTHKVRRWIKEYWDGELGREYANFYSWETDNTKAVSFHTLIEFYVMIQLAEVGVKTRAVLEAHKTLSSNYNTPVPFASKKILEKMRTDGKKIYFKDNGYIITLDGTKQLNLGFIELLFKKLDFDSEDLASRLWPLGKEKSILIDPERKFGHPVLGTHNIYPDTIYNHVKAGDPTHYIAHLYGLSDKQIKDAVDYCRAA